MLNEHKEEKNFIYTLGKIEAQVQSVQDQIRSGFTRLETHLNTEIAGINIELLNLKLRVGETEKYQDKQKAQLGILAAVAAGIGAVVASAVTFLKGIAF